jgi:hypothetical protein
MHAIVTFSILPPPPKKKEKRKRKKGLRLHTWLLCLMSIVAGIFSKNIHVSKRFENQFD